MSKVFQGFSPANDSFRELLSKVKNWEDYISLFIQMEEEASDMAWNKADLILSMSKILVKSVKVSSVLAKEIGLSPSLTNRYLRVALAFPPETRNPHLSFETHYTISLADKYDVQEGKFVSNNRFGWLEKAEEYGWNSYKISRMLADEKRNQEKKQKLKSPLGQEIVAQETTMIREAKKAREDVEKYLKKLLNKVENSDRESFIELQRIRQAAYEE